MLSTRQRRRVMKEIRANWQSISSDLQRFTSDMRVLDGLHSDPTYQGKFAAVYDGAIIGTNTDLEALIRDINSRYGGEISRKRAIKRILTPEEQKMPWIFALSS